MIRSLLSVLVIRSHPSVPVLVLLDFLGRCGRIFVSKAVWFGLYNFGLVHSSTTMNKICYQLTPPSLLSNFISLDEPPHVSIASHIKVCSISKHYCTGTKTAPNSSDVGFCLLCPKG